MKIGWLLALVMVALGPASPISPIQQFKVGRERMQEIFVLGDIDRAEWYLTLSEKRLTEADKLTAAGLPTLGQIQKNAAKKEYLKSQKYITALKDKADINYLLEKSSELSPRIVY